MSLQPRSPSTACGAYPPSSCFVLPSWVAIALANCRRRISSFAAWCSPQSPQSRRIAVVRPHRSALGFSAIQRSFSLTFRLARQRHPVRDQMAVQPSALSFPPQYPHALNQAPFLGHVVPTRASARPIAPAILPAAPRRAVVRVVDSRPGVQALCSPAMPRQCPSAS